MFYEPRFIIKRSSNLGGGVVNKDQFPIGAGAMLAIEAGIQEPPIAIPGSRGPQGLPGLPIPALDGIDGIDGFFIQGPKGNAGVDGVIGRDGVPGQDGYYGEDGFSFPGERGATGIQGIQGFAAPLIPGLDGTDADEPFAIPGERGLVGIAGRNADLVPGLDGIAGEDAYSFPGERGATGAIGSKGDVGPQGMDGRDGDDLFLMPGERGAQGNAGTVGRDGDIGPAGLDGADADTMYLMPGEKGAQGIKGDRGEIGPQGLDGINTDIEMHIPGERGPQGIQGLTGLPAHIVPGMDGTDGDDGFAIPGERGLQGIAGHHAPIVPGMDGADSDDAYRIPGERGAQGTTGTRGEIGPQALDGSDGAEYFPMPGARGATGATGAKSTEHGVPGQDGVEGPEPFVIRGERGATGAAGRDGVSIPAQDNEYYHDVCPLISITRSEVQSMLNTLAGGITGAGLVVYTAAGNTLKTEAGFAYNDTSNTLTLDHADFQGNIAVRGGNLTGITSGGQHGLNINAVSAVAFGLELGGGVTGDRSCFVDFHSDTTNSDYSTRINRAQGVNGNFIITNAGTGQIVLAPNATNTVFVSGTANGNEIALNAGSGQYAQLSAHNTVDAALSQALVSVRVEGGTSADPYTRYNVGSATTSFATGIDNSDSDTFKIAYSSTFATPSATSYFEITTAGDVTIPVGRLTLSIGELDVEDSSLSIIAANSVACGIEIGAGVTGDRNSYIDFHSDTTNSDYSSRIQRAGGVNSNLVIENAGTGVITLVANGVTGLTLASTSAQFGAANYNLGIGGNAVADAALNVVTDSGGFAITLQGKAADDKSILRGVNNAYSSEQGAIHFDPTGTGLFTGGKNVFFGTGGNWARADSSANSLYIAGRSSDDIAVLRAMKFNESTIQGQILFTGDTVINYYGSSPTEYMRATSGIVEILMGASATNGKVISKSHINNAVVGNVGTGEDDLMSYTLPANTLNAAGRGIRVTAWGKMSNVVATKTLRFKIGGTSMIAISAGTGVAREWRVEAYMFSTGTDAQDWACYGNDGTSGASVGNSGTSAFDDGAGIIIKCTGECSSASDNAVTQEGMFVEVLN